MTTPQVADRVADGNHGANSEQPEPGLLTVLGFVRRQARLLLLGPILAGVVALGISYLIPPTFTAKASFLPPQQQQSAATTALSQLGALTGLGMGSGGLKSPADQYVALMQSVKVADRIIEKFDLMKVYEAEFRFEARRELARNVRITLGKKDGLISVEVDDHQPARSADMANQFVEELRLLSRELALTEAQQRRVFFEEQLKQTRDRLASAQAAMQASGLNPGDLKAEPKATAETYARLRAEVSAAEVRLQALRRTLSDSTPEVQQQTGALSALRSQLSRAEGPGDQGTASASDYVGKYREFKYQEALFELYSRQFELARLDESREGVLVQVVDHAGVPEWKSKPRRLNIALSTAVLSFFGLLLLVIGRGLYRFGQSAER